MDRDATSPDTQVLRVGDIDFYCAAFVPGRVPDGCLPVLKRPANVARYVSLQARNPKVIVELGIDRGGSTALLHELYAPDTLVALEIEATPAPILSRYIEQRGVSAAVRPHYGIDQSDRNVVSRIMDDEIGDRAIDLVVDDASHRYAETRSSFETLFPRVRPGGLFIIEDWNADQLFRDAIDAAQHDESSLHHEAIAAHVANLDGTEPKVAPLTQLGLELMLVRASAGDVVREITVNENWIVIERGDEPLDPKRFRLSDHVRDHHFGLF